MAETEAPVTRMCPAQWPGTHLSPLMDLPPPRGLRVLSCLLGLFSQFSRQGCPDEAVLASPLFQSCTVQKCMLLKTGLGTKAEQFCFVFFLLASSLCAAKQISFGFEWRFLPTSFFKSQPYCPCFIISLPFEAMVLLSVALVQSRLYAHIKSSSSTSPLRWQQTSASCCHVYTKKQQCHGPSNAKPLSALDQRWRHTER